MVGIHDAMHYLRNLVHEYHHLVLQHLSRVGEVLDVTLPEDCFNPAALDHGIHGRTVLNHVLANDLRSSLSKAQGQELSKLDDGVLQDLGLECVLGDLLAPPALPQGGQSLLLVRLLVLFFLLLPVLIITKLHRIQRRLLDALHLRDHALYGDEDQLVRILAEEPSTNRQHEANEDSLNHVVHSRPQSEWPEVEDEHPSRSKGSVN
mmetsp:Transcript_49471/g.115713  ORF Transcript_49471/g.115713 Transcript_49471/m.115713 type:complete len:206 (-) Transcript_49471:1241-1858(-)